MLSELRFLHHDVFKDVKKAIAVEHGTTFIQYLYRRTL